MLALMALRIGSVSLRAPRPPLRPAAGLHRLARTLVVTAAVPVNAAPLPATAVEPATVASLQELLPTHCCGCGVKLQSEHPDKPGCAVLLAHSACLAASVEHRGAPIPYHNEEITVVLPHVSAYLQHLWCAADLCPAGSTCWRTMRTLQQHGCSTTTLEQLTFARPGFRDSWIFCEVSKL